MGNAYRIRRKDHVARMGEERGAYTGFWMGNLKGRYRLRDPGVDRRIFRKWGVWVWTESSWLRLGTGGGHL